MGFGVSKKTEAFSFLLKPIKAIWVIFMNTIWSTYVQGIETLYQTRLLRFSDIFKEKYQKVFLIEQRSKVLEIGCGPGALADSLSRWYPDAQIYGIDRDSNFIGFARKKALNVKFSEGDAMHLSFSSESFDVTISNTVAEHIEPYKFYGEQYRVLKDDGVCIVLSVRKGINIKAPCIREESAFEKDIRKRTERYFAETLNKYSVCAYPQNEAELPLFMGKYGFKDVTTDYITINLTPDDPRYSKEMAYAMINANRKSDLESVDKLLYIAAHEVSSSDVEELKRLVNAKYDKRLELYDKGLKQWDTNMSVIMVVRGIK